MMIRRCDSINLDGTQKPLNEERGTYGHAQKMRASMTYAFGRLQGLGNMWWHESDVGGGVMVGNPSISTVSNVWPPESWIMIVNPSQDILFKLYHHNHLDENWAIQPYQPGERLNSHHWGGGRARRLLQAAYTIAFVCMLRFDEVLKIQVHDFGVFEKGVTLHLPFRKTHQNGDIKPFHLWAFPPHEAHICPVRALAAWLSESRIKSGYPETLLMNLQTSEQFLELFRNNLLDIGIDPAPYGTHSFRRGGCQYLHVERRWALRKICEWGGWSAEFSNLTIVKYLISSNDDPVEPREHFFNPDRPPTVKCPHCGRCCPCG
ncbi:uncharacterized protein F5147DRAFT_644670 [Suillus discolor]|uniref:DNA breaking-rejoining enzyme n=1 Tax=Suillus discolor TaxID=1912936 RepID=A0A9P7ES74_9AGAM|nr:uncharacterized protein F5147DRAFT_644670 [Suillus discolor]KAG2086167.1 hypothetical protein F5147DRAFT_644670 [Suillus discolor]